MELINGIYRTSEEGRVIDPAWFWRVLKNVVLSDWASDIIRSKVFWIVSRWHWERLLARNDNWDNTLRPDNHDWIENWPINFMGRVSTNVRQYLDKGWRGVEEVIWSIWVEHYMDDPEKYAAFLFEMMLAAGISIVLDKKNVVTAPVEVDFWVPSADLVVPEALSKGRMRVAWCQIVYADSSDIPFNHSRLLNFRKEHNPRLARPSLLYQKKWKGPRKRENKKFKASETPQAPFLVTLMWDLNKEVSRMREWKGSILHEAFLSWKKEWYTETSPSSYLSEDLRQELHFLVSSLGQAFDHVDTILDRKDLSVRWETYYIPSTNFRFSGKLWPCGTYYKMIFYDGSNREIVNILYYFDKKRGKKRIASSQKCTRKTRRWWHRGEGDYSN